jgi:hypothetical protein
MPPPLPKFVNLYGLSRLGFTDKAFQAHEPQYRTLEQASNSGETLDFPPVWQVHHKKAP